METRSQLSGFKNGAKIQNLKITLSPCFVNILDGVKIIILKVTLSPCFVNIFDGDKIPIVTFLNWGQDRNLENHPVSMISKYFWWRQDPIFRFFLIRKILSLSFVNIKMELMFLLHYLLNKGIMLPETMSTCDVILKITLPTCFVYIFDRDKIPIVMFLKRWQDRNLENHHVPMLCKYFWLRQDPHCQVFSY